MSKPGPKEKLDDAKKQLVVALISNGVSRRTAAHYVGVCYNTLVNTAMRDLKFHQDLTRAESRANWEPIKNIMDASKKDWRAGAWLLERMAPDEYVRQKPGVITKDVVSKVTRQFADIAMEELADKKARRRFMRRIHRVLRQNVSEMQGMHGKFTRGRWPKRRRKAKGIAASGKPESAGVAECGGAGVLPPAIDVRSVTPDPQPPVSNLSPAPNVGESVNIGGEF